ncbi:MAG: S8 family serine peptidase [Nanoarchaeota archaeon]
MKIQNTLKILAILVLVILMLFQFYAVSAARNPTEITRSSTPIYNTNLINSNYNSKTFIVENSNLDRALQNGCTLIKKSKHISTVNCASSRTISNLGLQEDIELYGTNEDANTQINADRVLYGFKVTGKGRKIVILDTGYDYTHPELSSSYLGGYDFVNEDNDPMDDNGHGTHVAGIITADGLNPEAKGIAPDAGIISGKVLNEKNKGWASDIVEAIYWAVDGPDGIYGTSDDFNADAISISIGTNAPATYNTTTCDSAIQYQSMVNAINYADSHNVVVVISAGNNGLLGVGFPGCISTALTVGSVNSFDVVAIDSGRGPALDLVAPGVNILSTWLSNEYITRSGSSMAVPMVSGTIALLKVKKPNLTSLEVKNALTKTAKDLGTKGYDWNYGFGRVDVFSAFRELLKGDYRKPPIPIAT